jgi:hypothetical protein
LGAPTLTPDLKRTVIQGVMDEAKGRSVSDIERGRDKVLPELLAMLKKSES